VAHDRLPRGAIVKKKNSTLFDEFFWRENKKDQRKSRCLYRLDHACMLQNTPISFRFFLHHSIPISSNFQNLLPSRTCLWAGATKKPIASHHVCAEVLEKSVCSKFVTTFRYAWSIIENEWLLDHGFFVLLSRDIGKKGGLGAMSVCLPGANTI
jgi:hypothetical protein